VDGCVKKIRLDSEAGVPETAPEQGYGGAPLAGDATSSGGGPVGEVASAPVAKPEEGTSATPAIVTSIDTIKRQIEYYMSDSNLKYDSFFHDKISSSPEGWIPVDLILSCPKIKAMINVTAQDVIAALSQSHLEVKVDESGTWLRRTGPLPTLVRGDHKFKQKQDVHRAGCIVKVGNISEEVSWQTVKDVLAAKLPERGKISYVGNVSKCGECFLLAKPFENDKDFFNDLIIDVNGANVSFSLATQDEATAFLRKCPPTIRKVREKEFNRLKQKAASRGVFLAGTKFSSVDHLRQCVRELIQKTEDGNKIEGDSPAFNVMKALLAYHPRSTDKLRDLVCFKVGQHPASEAEKQSGKSGFKGSTKCVFVVRSNGEEEDFSVNKCIAELVKAPPTAPPTTTATEATPPAATAAAAAAEEATTVSASSQERVGEETCS